MIERNVTPRTDSVSAMRVVHLALALAAAVLVACSAGEDERPRDASSSAPASAPAASQSPTPQSPTPQSPTPQSPTPEAAASEQPGSAPDPRSDLDALAGGAPEFDAARVRRVGEAGDIRLAWMLTDIMRFVPPGPSGTHRALVEAFSRLTGQPEDAIDFWVDASNYLIANDVPAPDGYQQWKGTLYTAFVPEWAPFFEDPDAAVDWRLISWGGVRIDDRQVHIQNGPIEELDPFCGCIPALDHPGVTDAAGGDWYPDDRLVFGVVLNGEARAYPQHQLQVH